MAVTVPAAIQVQGVRKAFAVPSGGDLLALDALTFGVRPNEFTAIIGPSGCGKTTLLQLLHGLVRPDAGSIRYAGRPVTGPAPDRAMVFQDIALLPWATVVENVAFPLQLRGIPKAEREVRALRAIVGVGLAGFEQYYPHALSGGMQQRVGLARALVMDPAVLLLDEPFGALDAQTRHQLQDDLLQWWQTDRKTVVLVTHDMEEAVYLADRVLVLTARPGRVAQEIDVPLPRPRDVRVRRQGAFAELVETIWDTLRAQPAGRSPVLEREINAHHTQGGRRR